MPSKPKQIDVPCDGCGKIVGKPAGEVTRSHKLGRRLFCTRSCCATTINTPKRSKTFEMSCKCGNRFITSTRRRASRYCSRSCASRFSVTETRRAAARKAGRDNKQNLIPTSDLLKKREAWKYTLLRESLGDRAHEFEFGLGRYIYDLALFDTKTIVEFDGPDHNCKEVKRQDTIKASAAEELGWRVERRKVKRASVIHPDVLKDL
jgi:very-short-patch-repair endonuclease